MDKFQGKYRIASVRHPDWNYSLPGWYFITICTQNRTNWFGCLQSGDMKMSTAGKIVAEEWQRTGELRKGIRLDAWVLMPNHLHGIIEIFDQLAAGSAAGTGKEWKSGCLGAIVNQVKSMCTKRIHADGYVGFSWQPRYYDHIIRGEKELGNIRQYILDNPLKWELDEYYHS
jgi:REP element-mobilizing transposase RayT